jgi:membrane associated rhomboid family serine protease
MKGILKGSPATLALAVLIAAMFVLEIMRAAPEDNVALLSLGALPDGGDLQGQYWRLLTFGFLHWNALHFTLNAVSLLYAGGIVERRVGPWTTMVVFLAGSIASGIAIVVKHELVPAATVSVGASGGVFGLIGAAIVLLQRVPPANRAARIWIWLLAAASLAYSMLPGVSMVGHLAGLLVGTSGACVVRTRSRPGLAASAPN